jgi:hypothetical protein
MRGQWSRPAASPQALPKKKINASGKPSGTAKKNIDASGKPSGTATQNILKIYCPSTIKKVKPV